MITFKTENEILEEINKDLGIIGVSDLYESPVLASMFSPFIAKVTELNNTMEQIYLQSRLATATGSELEDIVYQITGNKRMVQLPPEDLTLTNFHFYLPSDMKAGDMTTDGDGFTIPAGVIVTADGFDFYTLDDAVFSSESTVVYTRVRATNVDTPYIDTGTLSTHNIDYTTIPNFDTSNPNNVILCSNDKPIVPSTYNETDDELRYRILQWIAGRSSINESTLRAKFMEIGVTDYIIHEDFYGVGRAGIEIRTDNPIVSEALLVQANEVVKSIYPGNRVIVPIYLPVQFTMELEVNDPAALAETKTNIEDAVKGTFNDYKLGTPLNITAALTAARSVDNVKSVDCNCVFIDGYKQSIESGQTIPSIPAQPDEQYIVDPDSTLPFIEFVVKS